MKSETYNVDGVKITIEYPVLGVDISQSQFDKRMRDVYIASYNLLKGGDKYVKNLQNSVEMG